MGIEKDTLGYDQWRQELRFHRIRYSARRFRDSHYHCIQCGREISNCEAGLKEGYVSLRKIRYSGFPPRYQWEWVCLDCFEENHERFSWGVDSGPLPRWPTNAAAKFKEAYDRYLRTLPQRTTPKGTGYAEISWTVDEVLGIASAMKIELSEGEAEKFLQLLEQPIRNAMVGPGVDMIRVLLKNRKVQSRVRQVLEKEQAAKKEADPPRRSSGRRTLRLK